MHEYKRLIRRIAFFCTVFLVAFCGGTMLGAQNRVALVIGNSAYQGAPVLANPALDAQALTAALEDSGFQVILRTDTDRAGMDSALGEFRKLMLGKETGLLYFAGYAVQVQGVNRLVAVNEGITGPDGVKSFSLGVDDVLLAMKQAGVKSGIVILDAARDNPFPAFGTDAPKGLGMVSPPEGMETMVVYGSEPGSTAQDIRGRNSQFTGALLKNLTVPGIEITELMRNVRTEVMYKTNNAQRPVAESRLTKPFVFLVPGAVAVSTPAATDAKAGTVVLTDGQSTGGDVVVPVKTAARTPQDDLFALAAEYRQKLAKLARDGASDNPDSITLTIESLEKELAGIEAQYARVLGGGIKQLETTWDAKLAELEQDKPQPWESDDDFAARSKNDKARVRKEKTADLMRFRGDCDSQKIIMTANIKKVIDDVLLGIKNRTWSLTGTRVKVSPQPYDRNAKVWDFVLSSVDPLVPVEAMTLSVDLSAAADIKAAWTALDGVVRANTFAADMTWGLERQQDRDRYALVVRDARLWNSSDAAGGRTPPLIGRLTKPVVTAYFKTGKLSEAISAMGELAVNANEGVDIYIDGRKAGSATWSGKLWEGEHRVTVRAADGGFGLFTANVEPGRRLSMNAAVRYYKAGDIGPSGGVIFYDKGSYSDGWRWLEAAPSDAPTGLAWYNGIHLDISGAKAKGPGSGKGNTRAVVVAQGPGNYAAMYCDLLVVNGFDDWFLPSKDELDLMYRNLKAASGGKTGSFAGKQYWSSSQYSNYGSSYDAWRQDFAGGEPGFGNAKEALLVRAVRAF